MKQQLKVTIDEETLELAKNNIPNISNFVENCFKAYLMLLGIDEETQGEKLAKAWEKFRDAQLEIHMLTSYDFNKKSIEKLEQKVRTDAWLQSWGEYRHGGHVQEWKLDKTNEVLKIGKDVLKQLLEDVYYEYTKDRTKIYIFDNWEYIEERFLPNVRVPEITDWDLDDLLDGKVDIDKI